MGIPKIFRKTKVYRYGKIRMENDRTIDARQCKRTGRVEYKCKGQKYWQVAGYGWEVLFYE